MKIKVTLFNQETKELKSFAYPAGPLKGKSKKKYLALVAQGYEEIFSSTK